MSTTDSYRSLTDQEVQVLSRQGCDSAGDDWSGVQVADGFDATRVWHTRFVGQVRIGALSGSTGNKSPRPAEIVRAELQDCTLGDNVRIANIGVRVANYEIGDGACIENVGALEAATDAQFGNGTEVAVLNEGGGREVVLFDALSSQFAHLVCLHRYRPRVIHRLQELAATEARRAHTGRGRIGGAALIRSVTQVLNVHVGPFAVVDGATALVNGSVLSSRAAPTRIGAGVHARNFIIAEGAQVTDGALVTDTYVGQASRVGRQFSAEGCLLFANCEAFHGEACSVFAGPYTVTHHKSTLLIAGMFSFYNAGSGTNQSNHMYKLGPIHEGRLERGAKTGSFSYMMWPCRVGPFCVVLGKHTRAFDTSDFPFSHIEALPDGRCSLIPGFNLTTVGTVRDGAKWPTRDRRTSTCKRDRISFDVFSPYTVGRMLRGMARLNELQQKTDRSVAAVSIGGTECKRVFLRTGQKYYRRGILMYLAGKIVARVEARLAAGATSLAAALAPDPDAVYSEQWVDIGGQLMPRQRLETLAAAMEAGQITDVATFEQRLDEIHAAYERDEWCWVKRAWEQLQAVDLDQADGALLNTVADTLLQARQEFLDAVLVDAVKEFDPLSRLGFGSDGDPQAVEADFEAVRGDYETNKFVVEMRAEIAHLKQRVEAFKRRLAEC